MGSPARVGVIGYRGVQGAIGRIRSLGEKPFPNPSQRWVADMYDWDIGVDLFI